MKNQQSIFEFVKREPFKDEQGKYFDASIDVDFKREYRIGRMRAYAWAACCTLSMLSLLSALLIF